VRVERAEGRRNGGGECGRGVEVPGLCRAIESVAAIAQRQIRVDVLAAVERTRGIVEGHALVAIDAEIGEHELGPVLMQVAEEHEPQALAERVGSEQQHGVGRGREPGMPRARLGRGGVVFAERIECGRARGARFERDAEARGERLQLGLRHEGGERVEVEHGRVVEPARRDERCRRRTRAADFVVRETACAELRSLAHQHAHEECARGARHARKVGGEAALGVVEQVGAALVEPRKRALEVREVVERIGRVGKHARHCTDIQRR